MGIPVIESSGNWAYLSSGTWSLIGVELTDPINGPEALEANYTNEWGAEHTYRFLKNITGMWSVQEIARMMNYELSYAEMAKANKGLPVVAINTTAGTSAEITINYVITDEERKVKMVMVDKNSLATISVNDPELMLSKPKALTAATGMDALTHAVEALVTPGAYGVTKKLSMGAIELIKEYLPRAVENGEDIEAREAMVNAIFLGGMAFNNAGLGYVHSMAHQLGAVYKLPHGVCCAMLLPVVERENAKRVPAAFRDVAKALGMDVTGHSDEGCADYAIAEIEKLSETVGIPKKLTELDIKEDEFDFDYLSKNALIDACAPGNPFTPTLEETIAFYKKLF